MFPWIPALFGVRKRLSDIEYMSIKEFDGKVVTNEGFKSTTGDLATLTAASGKDMYLASAKVIFYLNTDAAIDQTSKIELKVNGTVKETARVSLTNEVFSASSRTGANSMFSYEFKNIGLKVATTQIIKLEVVAIDTQTDIEGYLTCFEEATGETPQI